MEQQYNQTTDLFLDEPVVYAGFWERFGAAIIDGIVLIIPQVLINLVMPGEVAGSLVGIVISWLYYALQESGASQATLGKRAVGIKVTTVSGERITFGQASGRYFGKIISSLILCIGYLMMLWDDKKQTLHDKLAGTLVVKG